MAQDETETLVLFRKWPKKNGGDVDAYFPMERNGDGTCTCYAHVGQHGSADLAGCIQRTRPATPAEYADLKRELESPPYEYRLRVIKRSPPWRILRRAEDEMRRQLRSA